MAGPRGRTDHSDDPKNGRSFPRIPVGRALGSAFAVFWAAALPGAEFDSRLLFVLADPDRRDRMRTKVMQESLWGHGVAGLCAAMPVEAAS